MRTALIATTTAILTLGLAACGTPEPADTDTADAMPTETASAMPETATAALATADGQDVGTVTATDTGTGVQIAINAMNMPAGEHGVHVHTTGACDAPDFTSAGGHWNPDSTKHGLEAEGGQHAGDMPNLVIGEDGTGTLEYMLEGGATFAGLMDADGSAFILHEGADDQMTDPSGDSGSRIACGVFAAG